MYNYFKNDEKSQVIRLFIAVLIAIFAVELGIMLIIYFIQPSIPFLIVSIIDSMVLVLIVFPVIYLLNYRPLLLEINERKQAEEALRESETRYRMLFESAGDAIFILEAEGEDAGRIIAANKAAAEMHGYTVDELVNMKITDLDSPEAAGYVPERINRMLKGEWMKAEIDHRRKDGTMFPVEISAGLFELGKHKHILAFDRDITERKQAEETLKNYTAKLEEMNRLKDLFADIMHHDLLNPLGNIKLASETLLCAENMDKGMSDRLLMIKRNADRLIEMTRSAGTYARLESADKLEKSNHDLNEMFKTAANNFKSMLDEKNMKLDYQPKGRCYAMVNPVFEDVFSNLLSNAIKYSPAGNKIEVNIKDEKENCRFYIKDWGPGIKEEDKAKLFVRFQRADKGGVKGTGLGLAIVKRIVELHGGRVWIEDNPEGGSVFYVEIPKA